MNATKYLIYTACSFMLAFLSTSCEENVMDVEDDKMFNSVKGKPIDFEFNGIEEAGKTRAYGVVDPSATVWVSVDNGNTWNSYTYDSEKHLWKATGTPITWQQKTMTVYAYVRYDGGKTETTLTIQADQTNKGALLSSDFLGCREQITYTTGRISLTMKHRVAKLVVHAQVYDGDNPANLTACTTTATFATTGTISCGDMNVNLIKGEDNLSVIKLYRVNGEEDYDVAEQLDPLLDYDKTVTFVAYLFPLGGVNTTTNLTFKYGSLTGTTTVGYNLTTGITLDAGACTCYTVYLSKAQV